MATKYIDMIPENRKMNAKESQKDIVDVGPVSPQFGAETNPRTRPVQQRNHDGTRRDHRNNRTKEHISSAFAGQNPRRPPRKMVTHFLCLLMSDNEDLTSKVRTIQDDIVNRFGLPDRARVNVKDDLHISLLVLNLPSKEDESRVLSVLENTRQFGPSRIRVGIDTINRFGDSVLWARPRFAELCEHANLAQWRSELSEHLVEFVCDAKRDWHPHATILKTKAVRSPKPILSEEMASHGHNILQAIGANEGVCDVTGLSLLSCAKSSDGAYLRCGVVLFDNSKSVERSLLSSTTLSSHTSSTSAAKSAT
jgi:2'-5' RNA ligase